MRDAMLINMSGLEGHWMPIDLNIEHLIKFLKVRLTEILCVQDVHLTIKNNTLVFFRSERGLCIMGPSRRYLSIC